MSLDLNDITVMEKHFANEGDTALFPVLAELYYKQKDFEHARGVCEIGLDKRPDSVDGIFILSKIELVDKNLNEAEKLLKIVVKKNPVHIYALRLLMHVQLALGRSYNSIIKTVEHLLHIYPEDRECLNWLKENKNQDHSSESPGSEDDGAAKPEPPKPFTEPAPESTKDYIKVNSRMATFTLAEVFKKQENYFQALEILKLIETRDEDPARVEKERKIINKLMAEQELSDE